jgi:hypothetical protein
MRARSKNKRNQVVKEERTDTKQQITISNGYEMMQKERLVRLICFNDITMFSSGIK